MKFYFKLCSYFPYSLVPITRFLFGNSGEQYKIGFFKRLILLYKIVSNWIFIDGATTWLELLVLVQEVLNINKQIQGDVIELGCYKGRSSATLSIACSMVGRKLIVCDSFQGLPDPVHSEKKIYNLRYDRYVEYNTGEYIGTLAEVKQNISRYGILDVCEFIPGFFENTLPTLQKKFVLVFEDSDLPSSLKTILKFIYPHLQNGCKFYTEEAQDFEIASLFFNDQWWNENLCMPSPGLVGAGIGLPLGPDGSGLAYTIKRTLS